MFPVMASQPEQQQGPIEVTDRKSATCDLWVSLLLLPRGTVHWTRKYRPTSLRVVCCHNRVRYPTRKKITRMLRSRFTRLSLKDLTTSQADQTEMETSDTKVQRKQRPFKQLFPIILPNDPQERPASKNGEKSARLSTRRRWC